MTDNMHRLCFVVDQEVERNGYSREAIVRALLQELNRMAVEKERGVGTIHESQIGRYAAMFTRELLT